MRMKLIIKHAVGVGSKQLAKNKVNSSNNQEEITNSWNS